MVDWLRSVWLHCPLPILRENLMAISRSEPIYGSKGNEGTRTVHPLRITVSLLHRVWVGGGRSWYVSISTILVWRPGAGLEMVNTETEHSALGAALLFFTLQW